MLGIFWSSTADCSLASIWALQVSDFSAGFLAVSTRKRHRDLGESVVFLKLLLIIGSRINHGGRKSRVVFQVRLNLCY